MPELPNTRHELFAQNLAQGMSATAAYEAAGYVGNDGNAIRLKGKERILERVAELQDKAVERTLKTIEDIVSQLDEDRALARSKGQASAAVQATMGQAKVLGLITEKRLVGTMMTHEEALDELERLDRGKTSE